MPSTQEASSKRSNAQSSERPLPPDSQKIEGKRVKTNWDVRMQERQRLAAVKAREREMRQEKEDEKNRKVEVRRERQRKAEEKARLQAMAARVCTSFCFAYQMSVKKAQRHARRMGRTKKVAH